jgi:IclR family acetate operon transcriptional repressor
MTGTEQADARLVGADRVIAVLTELADHPLGVSLDELASTLDSPKSTVHRALATLRRAGLADLMERGVYVLGDEYLRLAFRNLDGRPETARVQPLLEELAERFGETAHYAVLAATDIVYRAKMDPPHGAVRLTSVVGGRNAAYSTAVGKVLLGYLTDPLDRFRFPLEQKTAHTLVTREALLADIDASRERGYGLDDQENEVGVNCLAIPVHLDGSPTPSGAVSISAVTFRCPLPQLVQAVPEIRDTIVRHLGAGALR